MQGQQMLFCLTEDIEEIEGLLKKYPNIGPRYSEREFKLVNK